MSVQVIDTTWLVLATANDRQITTWTKSEKAFHVWVAIAKACLSKDVSQVVFDRNGFLYHWRVSQVAAWARSEWLNV